MPTEEHNPPRSHQGVPQGVLARMHPLKILATTLGAALLLWGLLFVYLSSPAWAATITVNSTADPGTDDAQCTLREAITSANTDTAFGGCVTGTGDDVINVGVTGTVNLTAALPDLSSNIEIVGPGADQLTVTRPDTAQNFRIFTVSGDTTVVTISGMTISGGNVSLGNSGGGIRNEGGTLTITSSTISGNSAGNDGGAIFNNGGTLTITSSTISGNTAQQGGAIFNDEGTLTITSSTISGNSARAGGGVFSDTDLSGVTTTITNSTISTNTALVRGGGVINFDGLSVIEHSTISNNIAPNGTGSGVASVGSAVTRTEVLSTIISANPGTDVDAGQPNNTFVSNGYNLIGTGNATGAFNQTGDQVGVTDPKLGTLSDNGGPTQTHALLSGSPAINAIPQGTNGCGTTFTEDQRGVSRPQGSACDIGSFELEEPENQAPTVTVAAGGGCGSASEMRGTINLALSDPDDPPESLTLSATSSNRDVLPNRNIVLGGSGANRTLTVTSLTGSGTSRVTVTVSDPDDLDGSVVVRVIAGTSANNTLTGSDDTDMIFARKGSDTASGQGAIDLLCGGNGNDKLTGGPGADHFGGGSGTDTATDFNADEGDTMAGIP